MPQTQIHGYIYRFLAEWMTSKLSEQKTSDNFARSARRRRKIPKRFRPLFSITEHVK